MRRRRKALAAGVILCACQGIAVQASPGEDIVLTLAQAKALALAGSGLYEGDVYLQEFDSIQYEAEAEVTESYVDVYVEQEKISVASELLTELEDEYIQGEWKVRTGEMTQEELDEIGESAAQMEDDIAGYEKDCESAREKLAETVGIDDMTDVALTDPFEGRTAYLSEDAEDMLVEWGMQYDRAYHELRMKSRLALITLDAGEVRFVIGYGDGMEETSEYIDKIRSGEKVNSVEFKDAYDRFLTASGYGEEDKYDLYNDALEYQDILEQTEEMEASLRASVKERLAQVVTAQETYDAARKAVNDQEEKIEKSGVLNRNGSLTSKQLLEQKESAGALRIAELDAMGELAKLYSALDALTCGGVTEYLAQQEETEE